jgi:phosphoribosylglycinamide formyltransferase-1
MSTRVVLLLSGSGTSLENLIERSRKGRLDAEVVAVISSRAQAFGLERARRHGIPAHCVERYLSRFDLRPGYEGRVTNIHPALIPAFCGKGLYGDRVHRAVLEYGVKVTGATVHFCDEEYDTGPIILQHAVPVEEDDTVETLKARVLEVEYELYPRAIQLFAEGRLRLEGRRVRILPR